MVQGLFLQCDGRRHLREFLLPVITIALYGVGYVARMTRASMAKVMTTQYVRTARLKGLGFGAVVLKHALRNALIAPFTTVSYGTARHRSDTLLASGGLTPIVHLWRHAGGKLAWDADKAAFLPAEAPDGMAAIGAANGTFDLNHAIDEGSAAGRGCSYAPQTSSYRMTPLWPKPGSAGRQWTDFQHDLTL